LGLSLHSYTAKGQIPKCQVHPCSPRASLEVHPNRPRQPYSFELLGSNRPLRDRPWYDSSAVYIKALNNIDVWVRYVTIMFMYWPKPSPLPTAHSSSSC
jgi:hypothetical protein